MARVEDLQIGAIVRAGNQLELFWGQFNDMRDALKLTTPELKKMKAEFGHIEDNADRARAVMKAIRKGKFDTDARKLSVEYKEWTEKTKAVRQELSKTKGEMDGAGGIIELTNAQKEAIMKLREEYEKFKSKLSIITENEIKEAKKQIDFLSDALAGDTAEAESNRQQLTRNEAALKKVRTEFQGLINTFTFAGEEIPKESTKIAAAITEIELASDLTEDSAADLEAALGDTGKSMEELLEEAEPQGYYLNMQKRKILK